MSFLFVFLFFFFFFFQWTNYEDNVVNKELLSKQGTSVNHWYSFTKIQLSFSNKKQLVNVPWESLFWVPTCHCMPLCSSRFVQVSFWWADGSCGWPGSSPAGYYLGSPPFHCLSELLCGCTDKLLLYDLTSHRNNSLFVNGIVFSV